MQHRCRRLNPWGVGGFPNNPRYKDPYSHQWHFEVQRELSPSTMISVAYVGSKNGRLPYSGNANAARQASRNTCAANDGPCNTAFLASVDALRLMPWVGAGLNYTQNIGYSNYNALESKFQRRFSKGLSTLRFLHLGEIDRREQRLFQCREWPRRKRDDSKLL